VRSPEIRTGVRVACEDEGEEENLGSCRSGRHALLAQRGTRFGVYSTSPRPDSRASGNLNGVTRKPHTPSSPSYSILRTQNGMLYLIELIPL
jgi:hypothetical protein